MNKLINKNLLEKYNDILSSYKKRYEKYHEVLRDRERFQAASLDDFRTLVDNSASDAEVLIKLILSTFSEKPTKIFMNSHNIAKPYCDDKNWLEITSWSVPVLIEILSKILEDEKIKPKFDLTVIYAQRDSRNPLTHSATKIPFWETPRLFNTIREMLIFLDEDIFDKIPEFKFADMFQSGSFDPKFNNCTTVLISDSVHDIPDYKRKIVANLPWNYVIDLDGYSKNEGLFSSLDDSTKDKVHDMVSVENTTLASGKTNWCFCGTYQLPEFDQRKKISVDIPGKMRFCKNYAYKTMIEKVIDTILSDSKKYETSLLIVANTNDDVIINEITKYLENNLDIYAEIIHTGLPQRRFDDIMQFEENSNSSYSLIEAPVGQLYDYIYNVKDQFQQYMSSDVTPEYLVPSTNGKVPVSKSLRLKLEEYFDVLYIDKKRDNDSVCEKEKRDFYHGGIATWNIIDDIDKLWKSDDIDKQVIHKIETILGNVGDNKKLFSVKHKPGYGGSTIVRQVSWKLHTKYPVLYVKKYDPEIKSLIVNFYTLTVDKKPILLVADDTLINLDKLCQLMSEVDIRCCLLFSSRTSLYNGQFDYKVSHIIDEEIETLRTRFKLECRNDNISEEDIKKRDEDFLANRITNEINNPFMIGLHYFYDKYNLVDYIAKAFTGNKEIDSAFACIALCDIGGQKLVPRAVCAKLLNITPREDLYKKFPNAQNLICSIKDENGIPYYKFQNVLLSEEYFEKYFEKYYKSQDENKEERDAYYDLSEQIIGNIAELGKSIRESALDLLTSIFVKNKELGEKTHDDSMSGKLSIIVSKLTKEQQKKLLLFLAETFEQQLANSQSSSDDNITRKKYQLVSHTYAHLGRICADDSDEEKTKQYFSRALSYMFDKDPDIYHMYAKSLTVFFKDEFEADKRDNRYHLDINYINEKINYIDTLYDHTSEYGSPEYGMIGKLGLYYSYMTYIYGRENITKDNFNFNDLSDFARNIINLFMNTLEKIETELSLSDDILETVEKYRDKFNSKLMFGNFGKAIEYYQNLLDKYSSDKDTKEWQRAAFGLISARLQKAKNTAIDNKSNNFYNLVDERSKTDIYEIINQLLSGVSSSSISSYSDYMRISSLYHHWMQFNKILNISPNSVIDRLKNGWIYMEENIKLKRKSIEPNYYLAISYLIDAMDGKSSRLDDALREFSHIREKVTRSEFIKEDGYNLEKKRDILIEGKDSLGKLMDISLCKNNEDDIIRECVLNNVKPMIVEAELVEVDKNGLAELHIISPINIAKTKVYLKTGRNSGNNLNEYNLHHKIQIILCFTYKRLMALSNKKYIADTEEGNIKIDEIFNEIKKEISTSQKVVLSSKLNEAKKDTEQKYIFSKKLEVGSSIRFIPKYFYMHKYLNGIVADTKEKAGIDINEFYNCSDIEETISYYSDFGLMIEDIIDKGLEIECKVKSRNNNGYSLSLSENCLLLKNILAENTHENEKISNETYIKTEVEPVPVGKEVDLIINKSCNDKICGTFRHEGKEYKAKIVQPKLQKNEIKKLLTKSSVKAKIISLSGSEYSLKLVRKK